MDIKPKRDAREEIMNSIRYHLAASAPHDAIYAEEKAAHRVGMTHNKDTTSATEALHESAETKGTSRSPIDIFSENLEAVNGHTIVAHGEAEAAEALTRIISDLQTTPLRARRIALSNAPIVERLVKQIKVDVDDAAVVPDTHALFDYDVGITTAQAAIAETGTLVLESNCERHRLVSLLPPVHIAIVDARSICLTLGEALSVVSWSGLEELSQTITFITGPSRTADIELTLAIGVHGPQELHVIIIDDSKPIA